MSRLIRIALISSAMVALLSPAVASTFAADRVSLPTAKEVETLVQLARLGNPQAQFRLGRAYEAGSGTRQSYREAVRWYTAAANQGMPSAQFYLGQIFEEGRPEVKADVARALSWYEEAARNGLESAVRRLQVLTESPTP